MGDDAVPSAGRRYRIRSEALDWLDLAEEVVALDANRSVYLSTNSSGALLWHALAAGATRDELAEQLVASYGIDSEQAHRDVSEYLEMLASQGLLEDH